MSIDLKKLIKNQVHFGHQTSRWCPKMEPYIWGHKNNIHLIDVSKTAYLLDKAAKFLEAISAEGKSILWVGTKKAAQETIAKTAQELKSPYVVYRWVGGTFSNYRQVRKSIANLLHYEDIIAKSDQHPYNKKELNLFQKKIDRLDKNVGGIRTLTWPVGAVVIVDVKKEHVAIKEALTMGIPVVAIVDTNSDPSGIEYVIPGNDDAPRSVAVIIEHLGEAVKRGQEVAATRPQEQTALDIFELRGEDGGIIDSEDEEENAKRRRTQGARTAAKKPAGLRTRGPVKPVHQEIKIHGKSDAAGSTEQTKALETAPAKEAVAEKASEAPKVEKPRKKAEAVETAKEAPVTDKKKKK